jgi:hypothetical protein
MNIEFRFVEVLSAALSPVPVYYGIAPQKQDDMPIVLPVVIVNRIAANYPATLCGSDVTYSNVMLQVDIYHSGAALARDLADMARAALAQDAEVPTIEQEMIEFDISSKAWRVMQQWRAPQYPAAKPALLEAIR